MPAVIRSQARENGVAAVAGVPAARDARRAVGVVHREVVGAIGRAVRAGRGARREGRGGRNGNRGAGAGHAFDINRQVAGPAVGRGRGPRDYDIDQAHIRYAIDDIFDLVRHNPRFYIIEIPNNPMPMPVFDNARNDPHPYPDMLRPPPRRYPRFRGQYKCYICMQRYLEKEPTAIPRCGHIFCAACIRGQQEPRCPHCLEDYDPDTLTRIYLN